MSQALLDAIRAHLPRDVLARVERDEQEQAWLFTLRRGDRIAHGLLVSRLEAEASAGDDGLSRLMLHRLQSALRSLYAPEPAAPEAPMNASKVRQAAADLARYIERCRDAELHDIADGLSVVRDALLEEVDPRAREVRHIEVAVSATLGRGGLAVEILDENRRALPISAPLPTIGARVFRGVHAEYEQSNPMVIHVSAEVMGHNHALPADRADALALAMEQMRQRQ